MKTEEKNVVTLIYALIHLVVDLSCAFLIYAYVIGTEQWYLLLLVYNFCAFALQMPIGAVLDRLNRNSLVAACGCLGVLAGLGLGIAGYTAAAVMAAGVGNACFHVGAGIDVMNFCDGKAALLGLFVAPGALGIYLGRGLGSGGGEFTLWVAGVLLLSAAVIRIVSGLHGLWRSSGNAPVLYELPADKGAAVRRILAAACFLAAVILRSYSGMVQSFPWQETVAGSAWLLTGAVMLGKLAGGLLGDWAGVRRAVWISMCAAAVGFLFLSYPAPGLLAVFFWNMSMPLTLWAVSRTFPGAKGFGFGLLTFGLFVGFCPPYLEGEGGHIMLKALSLAAASPWGLALMAVISLTLLSWGLRQVED